jgi:hypothetical protein
MNDTQFDYLLATKEIQDKCIYTRKIADGQVQADELARYFGVDRIEIATGKIKKANIWGNSYMLLSLVSNNQALKSVPRIGNTFLWTGSTASNNVVQSYRDEEKEADIIRVKQNTDEKVISSACGILITGVVS